MCYPQPASFEPSRRVTFSPIATAKPVILSVFKVTRHPPPPIWRVTFATNIEVGRKQRDNATSPPGRTAVAFSRKNIASGVAEVSIERRFRVPKRLSHSPLPVSTVPFQSEDKR